MKTDINPDMGIAIVLSLALITLVIASVYFASVYFDGHPPSPEEIKLNETHFFGCQNKTEEYLEFSPEFLNSSLYAQGEIININYLLDFETMTKLAKERNSPIICGKSCGKLVDEGGTSSFTYLRYEGCDYSNSYSKRQTGRPSSHVQEGDTCNVNEQWYIKSPKSNEVSYSSETYYCCFDSYCSRIGRRAISTYVQCEACK